MQKKLPLGIFDSGFGGLSVAKSIHKLLPQEDLIYIADSAFTPYGDMKESDIIKRALLISDFLVNQKNSKAIVIACNTATAFAVNELRDKFNIPIIGMEPAVKPALKVTLNKMVGVLATSGTSKSAKFSALLERYSGDVKFFVQPCPGLVNAIEKGSFDDEELFELLQKYLANFKKNSVDTIVLGCTHFVYIKHLVKKIMGANIKIVDTSDAVARQLRAKLDQFNLRSNSSEPHEKIKLILTKHKNISQVVDQFLSGSNISFEIDRSWH
jgi:glutamate racemase